MRSRAATRFRLLVSSLVIPFGCVWCAAPSPWARMAHAQAAFRPVSVSDEQRSLGNGNGNNTSAQSPASGQTNLSPMAGTIAIRHRRAHAWRGRSHHRRGWTHPLSASARAASRSRAYIVDKGDVLQARLWGDQNFDVPLAVDPDGRLFIPRVGYISAHGRTLSSLTTEILGHLRARFPKLQSAVTLAVPRTFVVRVTGAVGLPGSGIPVNAWSHVSEAVQRAGGVIAGGFVSHHRAAQGERRHRKRRPAALPDVRRSQPRSIVLDGDCDPRSAGGARRRHSRRRQPSRHLRTGAGNVRRAARTGRRISPESDDHFGLRISSVVGDQRSLRLVDFHRDHAEAIDANLHHHDLVTVPTVDEGAHLVVKGALNSAGDGSAQRVDPRVADNVQPGRELTVALPFVDGETLRGAIIKAGGLAPWADLQNAWIEHSGTAARAALTTTVATPVASPIPSAAASGSGVERVPIDLRPISTENDPRRDIRLVAGDTVYIPSGRVDVVVSGHVMKPGVYGYSLKLSCDDYIALAGGETRDGRRTQARVVSLDGTSRRATSDVRWQPGDSITVPGKVLTTAEWVTISLGVISIGLSATLLAYNLSLSR